MVGATAHRCSGCSFAGRRPAGGRVSGEGGGGASRATGGPVALLWMPRENSLLQATCDRARPSVRAAGPTDAAGTEVEDERAASLGPGPTHGALERDFLGTVEAW